MPCHFRSKIRVCGNRCRTLTLEIKTIEKGKYTKKKEWATKLLSRILKFGKFWKFGDFLPRFVLFLQKNSLKFQNFQKTGTYVLE